jgi:hypothetical protein
MSKPLVDNAADAKQVERAEREERRRNRQAREDIREVMGLACGRRVIRRLLEHAGIYRLSYAGETNATMFNEGQRNVGLEMLANLNRYCPDLYVLMMQETHEATPAVGDDDAGITAAATE